MQSQNFKKISWQTGSKIYMEIQRIKNYKKNLEEERKITGSIRHEDLWYNYGNKEAIIWQWANWSMEQNRESEHGDVEPWM